MIDRTITSKTLRLSSRFLLLILLGATLSPAQDTPAPDRASSVVYVVDFDVVAPDSATPELAAGSVSPQDIAQLATSLIRLRLQETPALKVLPASRKQVCAGETAQAQAQNSAAQSLSQGRPPAIATIGTEFFEIGGSVDIHRPNLTVSYWLERCDGATFKPLASDRSIFTADRSNFASEPVLGQLISISQFLAYRLENPPTTVAVEPFQPSSEKLAGDLTRYIRSALTSLPAFELVDKSKNPDYVIDGSVSVGKTETRASIQVRSARNHDSLVTPVEVSTRKLQSTFRRSVASRVFDALNDMRLARRFGPDALTATSLDKLLLEGKLLLCEDQPPSCRQDPSAAVRVFEVARKNPRADWNASYYLGMALAANYKYTDATKSLTEALGQIHISPLKEADSKKALLQVRNALGDVYLKSGDAASGVIQLDESLKTDPDQPEVYVKKAETLFVSDRKQAMKVLLDAIPLVHNADKLHAALLENVRKLQDTDFEAVEAQFKAASVSGTPVNNEYAQLWVQHGQTGSVARDVGRLYAAKALDLHPQDVTVLANAYGLGAAMDLPGNLDEADQFLTKAEALPSQTLGANTVSWLTRLRAIYFLDRKDYAPASAWAEKARSIDGRSASDLLSATVANSWAQNLRDSNAPDEQVAKRFTQAKELAQPWVAQRVAGADSEFTTANHGLKRDADSKKVLEAILKDNPDDFSALLSLAFVCSEYLLDTECSYAENKKLVTLTGSIDRVAVLLNAAEAAVLNHEYRQATAWLNEALGQGDLTADLKAIADFYKLWIALVQKQNDVHQDFDQLLQSLTAYTHWDKPASPLSQWSFLGARNALARSELSPEKQKLLSDVMAVIDNPARGVAAIKLPSHI